MFVFIVFLLFFGLLYIIEISPDAKAIISGPADLHFKVGSAIILTCIVHQPSIKDIGPIYWYRGEFMITPFDINDYKNVVVLPSVELPIELTGQSIRADTSETGPKSTPTTTISTVSNRDSIESNNMDDGDLRYMDNDRDNDHISQLLTNEITSDFAQRIAMESQLGDTMKSR